MKSRVCHDRQLRAVISNQAFLPSGRRLQEGWGNSVVLASNTYIINVKELAIDSDRRFPIPEFIFAGCRGSRM